MDIPKLITAVIDTSLFCAGIGFILGVFIIWLLAKADQNDWRGTKIDHITRNNIRYIKKKIKNYFEERKLRKYE